MTNKLKLQSIVLTLMIVGTLLTSLTFADGLPGEYYITQRWRDLISPYSPATNPAFMTEEEYVSVRGAFSPSLGNTFVLYEGGVTVPIGLYQSVGLSVLGVNSNEPITPAVWDPVNQVITEEGDPFYDNHFHIMASYAINPWNRLSVGANLIFYQIPNFGDAISGFALDLGLTYRLANHPVLGQHLVGMSFQNVLSPDFKFEKLQQQSINGKISWVAKLWDQKIDLGIDLDFKDFTASAESFYTGAKNSDGNLVEAAKSLEFDFNSRIGFWLVRMVNVYGLFGNDYIGAAAGMNVPTIFGARDFQAAYQYMNMFGDNDIAYTHTVYFRGEFGPSREEIYAKKMAKDVGIKPGELWTKAMRLYTNGEYWDAMEIYGKILTDHPEFFQNPLGMYYIGRCQEEMEMRETGMTNFYKVESEYPASKAVAYAKLGILRLSYRENAHDMVKDLHSQLNTSTVTDSIRATADYYLGASYMKQPGTSNLSQAMSYFRKVPATHSDYPFAQHQLAICFAKQNKLDSTLFYLDNVVQFAPAIPAKTYQGKENEKAQKEIRNRSLALMGFLYFERKEMGKAITALREISDDSYYSEDGLLGSAWVSYKMKQWEDCKGSAEKLLSKSKHPMVRAEAAIMLASYHMAKGNYQAANDVLEPAEAEIRNFTPPTDTVLKTLEDKYYENRAKYAEVAMSADELIKTHETSYTLQKLGELKKQRDDLEKEVRSFDLEKDKQKRAVFFGRNPQDIKQAANYLLGKIKELINNSNKKPDTTGGMSDEERKLLEELEKLNQ